MDPFNPRSDIPLGGFLENEMASRLFDTRTIVINDEVSAGLAARLTEQLTTMAAVSDERIRMIITRLTGKDLEAGLSLFDLLHTASPPVDVLSSGQVGGAGLLAYVALPVQHRYSLPNARFVLQKGTSSPPSPSVPDAGDQTRVLRRRMVEIVAEATGRDTDRVQGDLDKPKWLSAREAQQYGLVGSIIQHAREME